ncbi:hypothetical protein ATL39_1347 [Sinobaca qinghaiensis]|uniref:CAAX prenyl protease 2/Lysostaphin resistance protein A-like domain-containing protein n=1 Tax=Sinobaca qinghaiensis TaxID=342944 RepID=A0A419V6W8_9BACL|nr:CPBP family intramembrane glutamic endopeptidase [Sinobaca qinghaiensis]RKD75646.1 hypothetical protein ATL39_1347 [Sinobaca qinghaiensis]
MSNDITLKDVWISFLLFVLVGAAIVFFVFGFSSAGYIAALFDTGSIIRETAVGAGAGLLSAGVLLALYKWTSLEFPDNQYTALIYSLLQKKYGVVTIAAGAGISEEFLFRGVLLGVLAYYIESLPALMIVSVIFMLVHVPQYKGSLTAHGVVLCIGLMLGWLFLLFGTLWAPIVAHALYNGLLGSAMKHALLEK